MLRDLLQDFDTRDAASSFDNEPPYKALLHHAIGLETTHSLTLAIFDHCIRAKASTRIKSAAPTDALRRSHYWLRFLLETLHRDVPFDDPSPPLSWKRSQAIPIIIRELLDASSDDAKWEAACVEDAVCMHKLLSTRVYIAALSTNTVIEVLEMVCTKLCVFETRPSKQIEKIPGSCISALCEVIKLLFAHCIIPQKTLRKAFDGFLKMATKMHESMTNAAISTQIEVFSVLRKLISRSDPSDMCHQDIQLCVRECGASWDDCKKDAWRLAVLGILTEIYKKFECSQTLTENLPKGAQKIIDDTVQYIITFASKRGLEPESILHTTSWRELQQHHFMQLKDFNDLIVALLHRFALSSRRNPCSRDLLPFTSAGALKKPYILWINLQWHQAHSSDFRSLPTDDAYMFEAFLNEWVRQGTYATESYNVIQNILSTPISVPSVSGNTKHILIKNILLPTAGKLEKQSGAFFELFSVLMHDFSTEILRDLALKAYESSRNERLVAYETFFSDFNRSLVKTILESDIEDLTKGLLLKSIIPVELSCGIDSTQEYTELLPKLILMNKGCQWMHNISFLAFHCCWKNGMYINGTFELKVTELATFIFDVFEYQETDAESRISLFNFLTSFFGLFTQKNGILLAESDSCLSIFCNVLSQCAESIIAENYRTLVRRFGDIFKQNKQTISRVFTFESQSNASGFSDILSETEPHIDSLLEYCLELLTQDFGAEFIESRNHQDIQSVASLLSDLVDIKGCLSHKYTPSIFIKCSAILKSIQEMNFTTILPSASHLKTIEIVITLFLHFGAENPEICGIIRDLTLSLLESHTSSCASFVIRIVQNMPEKLYSQMEILTHGVLLLLQGFMDEGERLMTPDRLQLLHFYDFSVYVLERGCPQELRQSYAKFIFRVVWHNDKNIRAHACQQLHKLSSQMELLKSIIFGEHLSISDSKRKRKSSEDDTQTSFTILERLSAIASLMHSSSDTICLHCIDALIFILGVVQEDSEECRIASVSCNQTKTFFFDNLDIIFANTMKRGERCIRGLSLLLRKMEFKPQELTPKILVGNFLMRMNGEEAAHLVMDAFKIPKEHYSSIEENFPFVIAHALLFILSKDRGNLALESLTNFKECCDGRFTKMCRNHALAISIAMVWPYLLRNTLDCSTEDNEEVQNTFLQAMRSLEKFCEGEFPVRLVVMHIAKHLSICIDEIMETYSDKFDVTLANACLILNGLRVFSPKSPEIESDLFQAYMHLLFCAKTQHQSKKLYELTLDTIAHWGFEDKRFASDICDLVKNQLYSIESNLSPDTFKHYFLGRNEYRNNALVKQKVRILEAIINTINSYTEIVDNERSLSDDLHQFMKNRSIPSLSKALRFHVGNFDITHLNEKLLRKLSWMLWIAFSNHLLPDDVRYMCVQILSKIWLENATIVTESIRCLETDILHGEPFTTVCHQNAKISQNENDTLSVEVLIINCIFFRVFNHSLRSVDDVRIAQESCRFVAKSMFTSVKYLTTSLDELLLARLEVFRSNIDIPETSSAMLSRITPEKSASDFDEWVSRFVQPMISNILPTDDVLASITKLCALESQIAKLTFVYCLIKVSTAECAYNDTLWAELRSLLENESTNPEISRFIIQSITLIHFQVSVPDFVEKSNKSGKESKKAKEFSSFTIPIEILQRASLRVKMPHEALLFQEMQYQHAQFPSLDESQIHELQETLAAIFTNIANGGKHFLRCLPLGRTFKGRITSLQNRGNHFWQAVLLDSQMQSSSKDVRSQLAKCYHQMNLRSGLTQNTKMYANIPTRLSDNVETNNIECEIAELSAQAAWAQGQWDVEHHTYDFCFTSSRNRAFHGSILASLTCLQANSADAFKLAAHDLKRATVDSLKTLQCHNIKLTQVALVNFIENAWKSQADDTWKDTSDDAGIRKYSIEFPFRETLDEIQSALLQIRHFPKAADFLADCALHAAKHKQPTAALAFAQRAENLLTSDPSIEFVRTIAKAFWKIGSHDFALDTLTPYKSDTESAFLVAKWKCQANRESVTRVLNDQLLPLADNLDTSSAYFTCAIYQDEVYSALRAVIESAQHHEAIEGVHTSTQLRAERHADFQKIKSHLSDVKKIHIHRYLFQQDRELKRSLMEIDQTTKDSERFCLQTLTSYAQVLQKGGLKESKMLTAAYRFISIWFENDVEGVHELVAQLVAKIPAHHFVDVFLQICARLSMPHDYDPRRKSEPNFDTFQQVLRALVKRVIAEHPHRTLYTLFAIANAARFPTGEDDLHTIDKTKITAAATLLREIMKEATKSNKELMEVIAQTNILIEGYIELAFSSLKGSKATITEKLSKIQNLYRVPVITSSDHSEGIYRFTENVTFPGGINLPKLIHCISTSGRVYKQLVKSKDDLRQDALVQQVFRLCNAIFRKKTETLGKSIRTYRVIPLTQTSGIVEWVENTTPLGEYLTGPCDAEYKGAHARYHPKDLSHAKAKQRMHSVAKETLSKQKSTFQSICQSFTPCFRHFFIESSSNASEAYEMRLRYSLSVATTSMVGHIVGLGDRHNSNILIDRKSGEVIHIDIGLAFDEGMLLPVPELVPFRLTRDIVDGMGITKTEGLFRSACEETLRSLRGARKMVNTVVETLLHDPLAKWSVDYHRIFQKTDRNNSTEKCSVDAARASLRVNEKLQGITCGETLSVEAQVQLLISQASSETLLCQMFHGWSAWV